MPSSQLIARSASTPAALANLSPVARCSGAHSSRYLTEQPVPSGYPDMHPRYRHMDKSKRVYYLDTSFCARRRRMETRSTP